jgi:GT2 family glycosyltransferase
MTRRPTLDVVIVTWNHGELLTRCLSSLAAGRRLNHDLDRVVVVDNGSASPGGCTRHPGLPRVRFVHNPVNRGFAAGCNQGGLRSRADYLLFLNPDTVVEADALDKAVEVLEDPSAASTGLLGLQIVDDRGRPQATCGRFPTPLNILWQVSGLSLLAPARFRGMRLTDWAHRESRLVDYASAAALLVRRVLFEHLGGFDERFFVYLEDVDLSLRARQLGWRTHYAAGAAVMHTDGWSRGQDRAWRLAQGWLSLLQYGWKHLGGGGTIAVALTIFLVAPAARLAQAAVHGSGRDARAALIGYAFLWSLLARRLTPLRMPAGPPVGGTPATDEQRVPAFAASPGSGEETSLGTPMQGDPAMRA